VSLNSKQAAQIKSFGVNLRRERMAKKITQERLAELVDLNIRSTHIAGSLESADRVDREIDFPPSAEWEKLPRLMKNNNRKYSAEQGLAEEGR
jgi:hypothetical protein